MKRILITGGSGNLGNKLILNLLASFNKVEIHVVDIKKSLILDNRVFHHKIDIRSAELENIILKYKIEIIYHLVAIISETKLSYETVNDIEINGLKNILNIIPNSSVNHFIFTSSPSVYGFNKGLPEFIEENQKLCNKHIIQYSKNKVKAENMITNFNRKNNIDITILRTCSILGNDGKNIVNKWFTRRAIIGLKNFKSPFCFIWDEELAICLNEVMKRKIIGTYNISSEGHITLKRMAELQNKRYIELSPFVLGKALNFTNKLSMSDYEEKHLDFIKYRPLLNTKKFQNDFNYKLKLNSEEVFLNFIKKT